jgi:hypothetical protein
VQVNPLYPFVKTEVIFDDGSKNGGMHHETRTLTVELLQRVWDTEGKVVGNPKQFNKHFKALLPYFEKKTGIKAEHKRVRDGSAWINVRLRDEGDEVLLKKVGQSTQDTGDDVTENTSFGESDLSNLVDYYRHLHRNPNLRHIITPCFVSISIEDLNAPELDFKASEGTIEEEPESENNVTETESAVTKGKCKPSQAELAEVIHDILTEFKHAAVVAKLKVDYSALREAVSARVRKDHPEWSEYDLEAAYDRFYEKDAEISAMIASVCNSSPKVHNEKKSVVLQ